MKFVIPVHSFVDVITNSSSELFVLDSKKSAEQVRAVISELWGTISRTKMEEQESDDYYKQMYSRTVDDMMTIYTLTGEEILQNERWYDWFESYDRSWMQKDKTYIVIASTDDNSIPWELVETIEAIFNGRRWHLG